MVEHAHGDAGRQFGFVAVAWIRSGPLMSGVGQPGSGVLRQAGLIRQRDAGNGSYVWLRTELDERFPGLLRAIRDAEGG